MVMLIVLVVFLIAAAIVASLVDKKVKSKRQRLDTIPLKKMQDALGISEHVQRVVVNGKPVYFDSKGKEL